VFGRTGAVIANVGDYSASMVTSAADVTAANIFTNAAGQSMRALVLPGATSGSLTIKAAPVAGTGVLIFPAWSTDFTATGGPSQVLRQSATGGPLLVARLDFTDLTGTGNICTTGGICSGYQPVITWGPGLTYSGSTASVASTQVGFLTNGLSTGLTCGAGASGKMQVLTNGEFQYCDGGATAVLRSGLPTQSGLTWSATVSTCLGDTNGGKLTINSSNQIVCAADQGGGGGGGGSITAVGTCTSGACFTDTSPSTRLTYATSTAPAAPSAGKGTVYVDSTSRNLVLKDEVGLTKHGMQTVTAAASQYLTGLNDDGTVTRAQPTKTDVGLGNVDNTSDLTKNAATAVLTNKQVVPRVVLLSPLSNVVTPNADTTDTGYNYSLAAATTVANPTATPPNPQDQQLLELVFKTAAPQVLSWGLAFSPNCGLALPTGTTGDGVTYNHFLFSYHVDMAKWCLIATTKGPLNRVTTLSAAANFACPWSVSDQCQMKLTSGFTTLAIQAPTGANDGDMVLFLLQCQATATLTWDPAFIDSPNVTRPTSCPSTTWNTTWMVMGVRFSTDLGKYQILGTD
jgi:hypothetical protein